MVYPVVDCQADSDAGADSAALFIATVPGRDAGTSLLVQALNTLPGFAVRGYAAGNGWMHLAEFAQRWIGIRRKIEDPSDPDHAYFEQFRYTPKDGFPPSAKGSDFRSLDELLRRRIKPAWYHFFNLSHVLCSVRQLVIHMHNPKERKVFGFVHMFQASALVPTPDGDDSVDAIDPTLKRYTPSAAVRSLDIFLRLFPRRGRVLINLPLVPLPDPRLPRPRCICVEAAGSRCGERTWPDARAGLMQKLLQHPARWPQQSLALSPQTWAGGRLGGASTRSLLRFLVQPLELQGKLDGAVLAGRRNWLASRLRWGALDEKNASLGTAAGNVRTAAKPVDACAASLSKDAGRVTASDPWCMQPTGCIPASAAGGQQCQACPASYIDLAWGTSDDILVGDSRPSASAAAKSADKPGQGSKGSKAGARANKGQGSKSTKPKQGGRPKQGGKAKLQQGTTSTKQQKKAKTKTKTKTKREAPPGDAAT